MPRHVMPFDSMNKGLDAEDVMAGIVLSCHVIQLKTRGTRVYMWMMTWQALSARHYRLGDVVVHASRQAAGAYTRPTFSSREHLLRDTLGCFTGENSSGSDEKWTSVCPRQANLAVAFQQGPPDCARHVIETHSESSMVWSHGILRASRLCSPRCRYTF
jgi:hypothetical protein